MNDDSSDYYFWKWADNDLPGNPREIYATLLRGEMHPALQPFDARPLLKQLATSANEGANHGEEWDWRVVPESCPDSAHFVFVTCPLINSSVARVERFFRDFLPLDLSGFDEGRGYAIQGARPKINYFINGAKSARDAVYDVAPDDLPVLIKGIRPGGSDPWGELVDRRDNNVCAFAKGKRFRVEWLKRPHPSSQQFRQWRARDVKRLVALAGRDDTGPLPPGTDPDFIKFSDTLKIFQAFLLGKPRPDQYHWRELSNVGYYK